MIIAPLGAWIGFWTLSRREHAGVPRWNMSGKVGWGMAVFAAIYVVLVIKVVLPYFRGGADVHFARYFPELGETSGEIMRNVITRPDLWMGKVINTEAAMFALSLLVPLGFLPLLSPGRLAVAGPLFGVLCLSEITHSSGHHFQAPLVPILLWSAAAGLGQVNVVWDRVCRWLSDWDQRPSAQPWMLNNLAVAQQMLGRREEFDSVARHVLSLPQHDDSVQRFHLWAALDAALSGQPEAAARHADASTVGGGQARHEGEQDGGRDGQPAAHPQQAGVHRHLAGTH